MWYTEYTEDSAFVTVRFNVVHRRFGYFPVIGPPTPPPGTPLPHTKEIRPAGKVRNKIRIHSETILELGLRLRLVYN